MKRFEVLMPECYQRFSCKGGDCRLTCCNGWNITFSAQARNKIVKRIKESHCHFQLLEKSKQIDDKIYSMVLNENGNCPFLTDDGICGMQVNYGLEIMTEICRMYPRVYHNYQNKLEFGLSLGCEKVLELLLEESNGLTFINETETLPHSQGFGVNIDDAIISRFPILQHYYDIQSLCLGLLQAKDALLEDKMILLGMALFHIDALVKENKCQYVPEYINKFINDMEAVDALNYISGMKGEHLGVLYSNLTLIQCIISAKDEAYNNLIHKVKEKLHFENIVSDKENITYNHDISLFSIAAYQECQKKYFTFIKGKEYFLENMAVAFMLYSNIPFYNPGDGVWKNYTYFIWTFTMIKFIMTVVLDENSTIDDMIDCCTIMFRTLGHSLPLYSSIVRQLEDNQNNTVAHMAVFLKSC